MAGPIIRRELRVEARSPSNYQLRLLAGSGLAVLFSLLINEQTNATASLSVRLFVSLHALMLAGIWVIGPMLTAESLSREKREGTLSLLFATDLSARAIVLGKGFVHIVRAVTLWLAALPFLTVPFLMGGVTWLDVISAFGLELCAVLLALPAGLLASSLVRHPVWAFLLAEVIGLSLAVLFQFGFGLACVAQFLPFVSGIPMDFSASNLFSKSLTLTAGTGDHIGWSGLLHSAPPFVPRIWLALVGEMALFSALVFLLLLATATWRTQHVWQDLPATAGQERRRRTWLIPRFWLEQFRQRRAQWLDRNPLAWLQQYSAGRRSSKLGWCGLILLADSLVMMNRAPWLVFDFAQHWLAVLLSLHITFEASLGFRREREAGLLELLLVAPISSDLITRHWAGFWRKFAAPLVLYLVLAELIIVLDMANPCLSDVRFFLCFNYLIAPVLGLYASVRFRSFAAAFALTTAFTLGLPLIGPEFSAGLVDRVTALQPSWFLTAMPEPPDGAQAIVKWVRQMQILMTVWCWIRLHRHLARREFAILQPSVQARPV